MAHPGGDTGRGVVSHRGGTPKKAADESADT